MSTNLQKFENIGRAPLKIHLSSYVEKRCPFRDERDTGTVEISFTANRWCVELHSLSEWLNSFKELSLSHEDFTYETARILSNEIGVPVTVKSKWYTGSILVTVEYNTN